MNRQAPHETQQPQLHPAHPAQAMQDLQPPTAQPLHPPHLHPPTAHRPPAHRPAPAHRPQPLQPRWANCTPIISMSSRSKTKNVPRLTSAISSSLRLIWGPRTLFPNNVSGAGPAVPVACAPPASAMDAPTAPTTGAAIVRLLLRLCFVRAMSVLPILRQCYGDSRHPHKSYPHSGRCTRLLGKWPNLISAGKMVCSGPEGISSRAIATGLRTPPVA
jgi:hypothetical protein